VHLIVIPARSGSKRLANKNIMPLQNKPLMAYAIDAARKALKIIGKGMVVVSSDSEKYLDVATKYGAVGLKRPDEISGDETQMNEVMKHVTSGMSGLDSVTCLQPTSPLVLPEHIAGAIRLYLENKPCTVMSVYKMEHYPEWIRRIDETGKMKSLTGINTSRSQELEPAYYLNGAIRVSSEEMISKYGDESDVYYGYIMPKERSVDIDSYDDFKIAEVAMRRYGRQHIDMSSC